MKPYFAAFVLVATLAAGEPPAKVAAPAEIPVPTLFQAPSITALTFSPNGKYIACLVPYEHCMNVAVIDLEKGTKNLLTNFTDRQALRPRWAGNDRLLFEVDDAGKESYDLNAVGRDGSNPVRLAAGYSRAESETGVNLRFRSVLGSIEGDPRHIMVLANITYRDWSDVALLDIQSGEMKRLIEAPGRVEYYVRDRAGQVRLAVVDDHGLRRVLERDAKKKDWVELTKHRRGEAGWEPLAFDGDDRTVFVLSGEGRRTAAVRRYDLQEHRDLGIVLEDETYDATDANGAVAPTFTPSVIYDASKHKVVGLSYAADRTRFRWLDPDMQRLQEKIEASLPDTVHHPRQFTEDGTKIIYFSYSDRDPGVYYLYDRARQKMSEIAVVRKAIDPDKMSPVKPITFTARDGLVVHGYLTLPLGRAPKKLPLVLHPHGGPFSIRDEWVYNDEVQFYANRGYAVLQVNYRGSGGYGAWFQAAGYKKWGLEMQNDLTDGVKWVIEQGIADPARVVISGASYGGYATMAGLAFTPELYCAGINYVGVTNLSSQWGKYHGTAAELNLVREWFADMEVSAERQRAHDTSPCFFAERIQAPVLMAYGRNDPRVAIDQGYDMESALKRAGKTYEMIIEEDEGHGFRMEAKRVAFFERVDAFLKKYVIPAGAVKIGPTKVLPGK